MHRRDALRAGGLITAAAFMGEEAKAHDLSRGRLPFGTMTADKWGAVVDRVTIDGLHIYGCYECNEVEGWVKYWPNAKGDLVVNGMDHDFDVFSPQIRYGRVEVFFRKPS